jgi:hypothetical protein
MDDTYRKYRQRYDELVEMRRQANEQAEQQRREAARQAYNEALSVLESRFGLVNAVLEDWMPRQPDPTKDNGASVVLDPKFWPPRESVYVLVSFEGSPKNASTVVLRSSEGGYDSRLRAPCSREEIERAIAQVFVPAVDSTAPKLPD